MPIGGRTTILVRAYQIRCVTRPYGPWPSSSYPTVVHPSQSAPLGGIGAYGRGSYARKARNVDMGDYQAGKNGKLYGAPSRFEVKLTEAESRIATWVGKQRRQAADKNGRDPGLGSTRDSPQKALENSIRGAHCEYAASIAFNLSWRPFFDDFFDLIDVGGIIDTRSTDLPTGRLIIKQADVKKNPHVPYVLVDCQQMDKLVFVMKGWRYAKDAPEITELNTKFGDPAYFITQDKLYSNESLVDWVTVRRAFD